MRRCGPWYIVRKEINAASVVHAPLAEDGVALAVLPDRRLCRVECTDSL